MNLREAWERVARADRFVYGVGLVLVLLSFLPHVPQIAKHFVEHWYDGVRGHPTPFEESTFEKNGQGLILGVAVFMVFGWEVAKEAYQYLSESGPIVVGVLVAVPVAAPLTALAAWMAKLFAANAPDHPLFTQLLPLPWGVGVTVYLLTTALVVVGLRELKAAKESDQAA